MHTGDVRIAHCVVEALIVNKRKAEIEKARLSAPVNFAEQDKVGCSSARLSPEFLRGRLCAAQERLPDSCKNVVQLQHGHITANAIAMARDGLQIRDLGRSHLRLEVIQLR